MSATSRQSEHAIDYDTFTDQTVSEAVGLTNLVGATGSRDTRAGGDETSAAAVAPSDLHDLLHLYALVEDPVDVAGFVGLAQRLRAVFEAPSPSEVVERLNSLLTSYEPRPAITEHDGQAPHFHYVPDDGPDVQRVGASLAMALANVVVDHGPDRLGHCAATTCSNVFVDRTRNHSQRYCSKTCATRVHVAAHRARVS
ncbi:MAG TPA: CGNR zinc finger domain-containing protein [Nitriliruptoraceae bacterium]|nr:CGNR zinc finger domain-containing protein [Nitriliruptoraceae bacterium]